MTDQADFLAFFARLKNLFDHGRDVIRRNVLVVVVEKVLGASDKTFVTPCVLCTTNVAKPDVIPSRK